jgi:hypothetical protein
MAIAAGVAAAAATAISVGASVASQAGAFGGGEPGKPQIEQVPKRPFETAQQKYLTRVMMANLNTRGPTYQEWLKSGGTAKYELQGLGMTPQEAQKMGFVGPGGRAPAWVDPAVAAEQGLTPEQYVYGGIEAGPKAKGPQARLGRVQKRIERLEGLAGTEAGLRPGQEKRLERLRGRKEKLMAKGYGGGV